MRTVIRDGSASGGVSNVRNGIGETWASGPGELKPPTGVVSTARRKELETALFESAGASGSISPLVNLSGVTLGFGKKKIFDGLDLSVAKGERLVVMGMSGSGKSTLLKLIMGTRVPDGGAIRIFGEEITRLDQRALNQLRLRIALVFQYGALISSLTVRENLSLALEELTEKSPDEIEAVVREKLRFVGLPETAVMMPYELSGGMQKRISIARALVMEPELLLFDEPTAGLDPISSHVIDELIVRLNEEMGVTEIMIGHKVENAFRVGTRIAILDEGKIVAEGTPEELRRSSTAVVTQFLASMAAAMPAGARVCEPRSDQRKV